MEYLARENIMLMRREQNKQTGMIVRIRVVSVRASKVLRQYCRERAEFVMLMTGEGIRIGDVRSDHGSLFGPDLLDHPPLSYSTASRKSACCRHWNHQLCTATQPGCRFRAMNVHLMDIDTEFYSPLERLELIVIVEPLGTS
jgi:hypothetical protein